MDGQARKHLPGINPQGMPPVIPNFLEAL